MKLLSIILLLLSLHTLAQPRYHEIDRIKAQIGKLQQQPSSFTRDTTLIHWYQKQGQHYEQFSDVDSAIVIFEKAKDLSKSIGYEKGYYFNWHQLAEAEHVKSRYFSSIKLSLSLIQELDSLKYPIIYALSLKNIAGSYFWMERAQEARHYYATLLQSKYFKLISTATQYDCLAEYGNVLSKYFKEYEKGQYYFNKAEAGYLARKDTLGIAYLASYKAAMLEQTGKVAEAEHEYLKSIAHYKKIKADYLLADALNFTAAFYNKHGQYAKAEPLAKEALEIANRIKILFSQRDANRNLYAVYKATGQTPKALFHFESFSNARDSMAQATLDDRLKVVRYEYDTELQRAEIDKKTRENEAKNRLIYSLLFGIVAFGLAGLLAYRNTNIRKKIAEQEVLQLKQEKQLIATQSVLAGQEAERSRLAKDLHDGLGGLLSGIKLTLNSMTGNLILTEANARTFDKALAQLDNAMSEMRRVAHSMMPEALLKFGLADALQDYCENIHNSGQLKVYFQTIGLTKNMPQELSVHFYRIVQELLNNVIKHAQATQAQVQLVQDGQLITLTVEDNGRGFDPQHTNKGAGLESVRSRVAALGGHIDIHSDARGTSIEVQYQFPS